MIITRSPLRISLGGGGTDLPSYYREHGGFLIAAAIDKYVYITLHQTFVPELIVKYSKLERVADRRRAAAPDHPRGAAAASASSGQYLEITSMADIPAGTGLGSSGSFTTALLKALHAYKKNLVHPRELAEQACHIEIDLLERADRQAGPVHRRLRRADLLPVPARRPRRGRAAARSTARRSTTSKTTCCCSSPATAAPLGDPARSRTTAAGSSDKDDDRQPALREGARLPEPGGAGGRRPAPSSRELMNVHWEHKKQRSGGMSNAEIDALVRPRHGERRARRQADRRRRRRLPDVLRRGQDPAAPRDDAGTGLREVRFRFDFEGTQGRHPVSAHGAADR